MDEFPYDAPGADFGSLVRVRLVVLILAGALVGCSSVAHRADSPGSHRSRAAPFSPDDLAHGRGPAPTLLHLPPRLPPSRPPSVSRPRPLIPRPRRSRRRGPSSPWWHRACRARACGRPQAGPGSGGAMASTPPNFAPRQGFRLPASPGSTRRPRGSLSTPARQSRTASGPGRAPSALLTSACCWPPSMAASGSMPMTRGGTTRAGRRCRCGTARPPSSCSPTAL